MKIKIILLTAWSAVGFTQSIMARQLENSKPIEVDSSTATGKALTNYLMQHNKIPEDSFGASLYKVPGASNLYFAIGSTGEQNTEEQKDLVLVLEAQGKTVNEVAKVYEKGMQGPVRSPLFFVGPNRILMVVSSGFADGGSIIQGNLIFGSLPISLPSIAPNIGHKITEPKTIRPASNV